MFVTRIVSQLVTGVVFGLATFALLYVNLRIARRMAPKAVPIGMPEGTPEQLEMFIESLRGKMGPILDRAILWGCLVLAFFNGLGMSIAVGDVPARARVGAVSLQRPAVRAQRRLLRLPAAGATTR